MLSQLRTESVLTYFDLSNNIGVSNHSDRSGNSSFHSTGIVVKTLFLVSSCRKAPIKSSWYILYLSLAVNTRNIFRTLKLAMGHQVWKSVNSACWSPLGHTLAVSLSIVPSDLIFVRNLLLLG